MVLKIWTDLSSSLSQITRLTDGRTDRRTDGQISRPRLHSMQRGKNCHKGYKFHYNVSTTIQSPYLCPYSTTTLTPDTVLNVLMCGSLRFDEMQHAGKHVKWP